ncbi:hypothetical protein SAMN02910384_01317 [Pseudobutyrivibrio sp. ACV-2]|nr:hypothetical protein SAMN02910384_01317 [Pseudobutyrivibrio sp. ACV-2]
MIKCNKNIDLNRILLFICLVIIFIHSFFIFRQKDGLDLDENASFQLANWTVVTIPEAISAVKNDNVNEKINTIEAMRNPNNCWITEQDIMSKYTVQPGERFAYFSTFLCQAFDVHPPLFYLVIKTICSLVPSLNLLIVGYIINITFLLLACYFIYKIGLILFDDNSWGALAAVLYYGLSFDFVNNATFYRMYAILTFWFVFLLYNTLKWANDGYADDKKVIRKLCIIEALAMYTQYFAVFFIFPMFVLNLVFMIIKKIKIRRYLKYNIITGLIYLLVWPFSIVHILFTDRGADVKGNLNALNIFGRLYEYKDNLFRSIFSGSKKYFLLFAVVAICYIAYRLIKHKFIEKDVKMWIGSIHFLDIVYVFGSAIAYYVVAAVAAPWAIDRYVMPAMPVLSLIITFIIIQMMSVVIKNKYITSGIMCLLIIALCLHWHQRVQPYYLFNSKDRVEYKKTCYNYDGVVIDSKTIRLLGDIELNYKHPKLYVTDEVNYYNLDSVLDDNKTYMVYMNKDIDNDEVISTLESKGFKLVKNDCEADHFYIYTLN